MKTRKWIKRDMLPRRYSSVAKPRDRVRNKAVNNRIAATSSQKNS
jgi:hypothetical protein